MSLPVQHLRDKREARDKRRLAIAQALRENPKLTNIELAAKFDCSRNTIHFDRLAIVEQLKMSTLTETEQLRASMVNRLESLAEEVEAHRRSGKLSLQAIDRLIVITREVIALTGCRKSVTQKIMVSQRKREHVTFECVEAPQPCVPGTGKWIEGSGWINEPEAIKGQVVEPTKLLEAAKT